jgi:hypothetical protein
MKGELIVEGGSVGGFGIADLNRPRGFWCRIGARLELDGSLDLQLDSCHFAAGADEFHSPHFVVSTGSIIEPSVGDEEAWPLTERLVAISRRLHR